MKRFVGLCVFCFWAVFGWCNSMPNMQLKAKLQVLHSFSAHFSQTIVGKRGHGVSSGVMAFVRPSLFYWETQKPNRQKIIADGHKIWIYYVDLEQVSVRKQSKGLGGTAGIFLTGYNDAMMRQFNTVMTIKGRTTIFDLQAKSQNKQLPRIQITFKGNAPVSMEAHDALGHTSRIQFSQIKINPVLNSHLFQLKAPKNVDVVWQ